MLIKNPGMQSSFKIPQTSQVESSIKMSIGGPNKYSAFGSANTSSYSNLNNFKNSAMQMSLGGSTQPFSVKNFAQDSFKRSGVTLSANS